MGVSLGNITMGFGFELEGLLAGIEGAKKAIEGFQEGEGKGDFGKVISVGADVAAVGLVALGTEAVKSAAEFQEGMTLLKTAGGETEDNMKLVSSGIMSISVATGTMTSALLPAMLSIEASGQHGAEGLKTLQAAAEGAKVSGLGLTQVTKMLDDTMKAFHLSGTDASSTMSVLNAAALAGHDKLQEFGQALQRILPSAYAAGQSLTMTTAAMATLTDTGMKSALAANSLKLIIGTLETPSKAAATTMTALGLSTAQVAITMRKQPDGMISALQEISVALAQKFPADANKANAEFAKVKAGTEDVNTALSNLSKTTSPEYQAALKSIAGSTQNVTALTALTGSGLVTLKGNFDKISGAAKDGKTSVTGFKDASGDLNFKLEQLHAAASNVMVTLGGALLPVITNIATEMLPVIQGFASFVSWMEQGSVPAKILGGLLLGVVAALVTWKTVQAGISFAGMIQGMLEMIPKLITLISTTYTYCAVLTLEAIDMILANLPIILIVAGIIILIAIIILLITHWGAVVTFLRNVWGAFASWFGSVMSAIGTFFRGVWNGIASFFEGIWNHIVSFATGIWTNVTGFFKTVWGGITSFFEGIWNHISSFASGVWNNIVSFFKSIWGGVSSFFMGIWNTISSFLAGVLGAIIGFVETWGGKFVTTQARHLQEVWAFFVSIYNKVVSFLTGVWNGVVVIATTIWNRVTTAIMAVVTPVINMLRSLWSGAVALITALWNGLMAVARTVWNAISTAIMTVVNIVIGWLKAIWNAFVVGMRTLWNLLVGIATTVWNAVSTAVMAVVNTVIGWLTAIWNAFVLTVQVLWNLLSGLATTAWNAVSSAVMGVVNTIIGWVVDRWNTFKANISASWNALSGLAQSAWNAVTGVFQSAWGNISSALGSLLSNITGWFNNIASQATQWGINIIQNFINGIGSMVGAVGQAAGNILGTVKNFLFGGSPTKEGPGRELMKWGPSIAKGFADGLVNGIPLVRAAMNKMIAPLSVAMTGSITNASATPMPAAGMSGGSYGLPSAGQQGVTVENHFYMDGSEMTDQIITRMTKKIRAGNPVGRSL